ncbi:hypothetical protein J2129_001208 [Methanofollis sp. W23]|nr:hypothetical protein [Methanofollis sp. W23]
MGDQVTKNFHPLCVRRDLASCRILQNQFCRNPLESYFWRGVCRPPVPRAIREAVEGITLFMTIECAFPALSSFWRSGRHSPPARRWGKAVESSSNPEKARVSTGPQNPFFGFEVIPKLPRPLLLRREHWIWWRIFPLSVAQPFLHAFQLHHTGALPPDPGDSNEDGKAER